MCSAKKYLVFHDPLTLSRNEGLFENSTKLEAVLRVPAARSHMQSQGNTIRHNGNTEDRTARLLSQHELDQEYLYRLWKAGRINDQYVESWANALCELQAEAKCDYFAWLMKNQPMLV